VKLTGQTNKQDSSPVGVDTSPIEYPPITSRRYRRKPLLDKHLEKSDPPLHCASPAGGPCKGIKNECRYINQIISIMANTKKNGNMPNAHLHELFVDELKDVLSAEKQLLKGLKKMASKADRETLKSAFELHYTQTEEHIERLKQVFQSIGMTPRAKKCIGMESLLKEAEEIMEEFENAEVLDAALIAAAQKAEHYEIAAYGCLVTYAKLMEHQEAEEILSMTLNEEKETDTKLTDIAMEQANVAQ